MPFTEDLSVFFNTAEFADEATLNGVGVVGIFDKGYSVEDIGGGASVTSPTFTLPSSLVPSPVKDLPLIVDSITYKVAEPMPFGGITKLRLRT